MSCWTNRYFAFAQHDIPRFVAWRDKSLQGKDSPYITIFILRGERKLLNHFVVKGLFLFGRSAAALGFWVGLTTMHAPIM
jgi:hypothetical protein